LLLLADLALLCLYLWFRRKELREIEPEQAMVRLPPSAAKGVDSFTFLDFKRTFPHTFCISTITFDRDDPTGFRYKVFVVRREAENLIELHVLRQSEETGLKREVIHAEGPLSDASPTDQLLNELQREKNVEFERFNFSNIRTFDEFKLKAIELRWDASMIE
jgi:hypothetical protein